MVPWAGRVRRGRFMFAGAEIELPLRMPPHAIHGTVLDRAWTVTDANQRHVELRIDLGPDWPWLGHVEQTIGLDRDGLRCHLALHSDGDTFPGQVGWHPWFADGDGAPSLVFAAQAMYPRDDDYITVDEMVPPTAHPWDDCFVGVTEAPRLRYADGVQLTLMSDCDHWVVYEPGHAVCVEPQSGPPDGFTLRPEIVSPKMRLSRTFTIGWERPEN